MLFILKQQLLNIVLYLMNKHHIGAFGNCWLVLINLPFQDHNKKYVYNESLFIIYITRIYIIYRTHYFELVKT